MFITFEGGEGCGKSTHSKLLKQYLVKKGYKVVLTLEPGGTRLGGQLRHILLKSNEVLYKFTELFLFAADRLEHVDKVIKPAIKKNYIVICDRFIDSTEAYQAGGRKLSKYFVRYINKISSHGLVPDLTLLLDVDPKKGIARGTRNLKKDKFETEGMSFHNRVRAVYKNIARKDPKRVKTISTSQSMEKVQEIIRRFVSEKL